MGSIEDLIRDVKAFEGRREVLKAFRKRIRQPVPPIRRAVRARALATLPSSGGLGAWVAASRVNVQIKLSGRSVGVRLRAGRNSKGGRSDVRRIDAGRVRAPSWGRKTRAAWHTQQVTPGWFTGPAGEVDQWRGACLDAIDDALEVIAGG